MENNKAYRLNTRVDSDKVVTLNLEQDFDTLELLSLKVEKENLYRLHSSQYGCVVGRVLANGGFGIPNAKVSVFIGLTDEDSEDSIISGLYPYRRNTDKRDNIRYNLLTEEQINDCHRQVGTFPTKRTVLDDNNVIEVYDKYYKYTTTTNNAGDYMIFGVPVGEQILHVDLELSDIGILSQRPRDLVYKGYNITQFENPNMFKKSDNLDSLSQIISQNETINVESYWGDEEECEIKITRSDININYEFEPTCVFLGSMVTDEPSNGIKRNCIATPKTGQMDKLTTGNATIEMIRKTIEGDTEEFTIMGNQLIDGNGTWCYQIPMNLDYMATDEYGNMVPTSNPTKGIPTRARVRFRIALPDENGQGKISHVAKVLVPHNPQNENEIDYIFGTNTSDYSYRDIFWNNVYTVKSHIPRIQRSNRDRDDRFTGVKRVNVANSNNPIPYNNMRVNITFMFTLQCAIMHSIIWICSIINRLIPLIPFKGKNRNKCIYLGDGVCPDLEGWYFAPGCNKKKQLKNTVNSLREDAIMDDKSVAHSNKMSESVCVSNNISYFTKCMELNLALMEDVIQFDFYNDWINGLVYIPRWFATFRRKRSYLWGLYTVEARVRGCMEDNVVKARRYVQQCALEYSKAPNSTYSRIETPDGCNSKMQCNKKSGRKYVSVFKGTSHGGGLVHGEENMYSKYVYYFRPCEWLSNKAKCNLYATDLVLLGSLNENDANGVPVTFSSLLSSTYQMPSALADTNLDKIGMMLGTGSGTYKCAGSTEGGVKQIRDTYGDYEKWMRGQSDSDRHNNIDETEYPITESSGIDWGYEGPGQEYSDGESNKLYNPGGHFLSISCFNSAVNIKSCVNLSRICEIGVMPSTRQALPTRKIDGGNETFTWTYLIPNGFISKDEIIESSFRRAFATLNHNKLKTVVDPVTGYLKYDFKVLNPNNFGGDLTTRIPKQYNTAYLHTGIENGEVATLVRSFEENSLDYYRFRLGVDNNFEKRYLIRSGNKVSMPVFENSFYFYFGLRNGSTALDRFLKEFYAVCPNKKAYETNVKVTVGSNASVCKPNDGWVHVAFTDILPPLRYTLRNNEGQQFFLKHKRGSDYTLTQEEEDSTLNRRFITIGGFEEGSYSLSITGANSPETITSTFYIGKDKPDLLQQDNIITTHDLKKEKNFIFDSASGYFSGDFNDENGGYITCSTDVVNNNNIRGIVIHNIDYYYAVGLNGDEIDNSLLEKIIKERTQIIGFKKSDGTEITLPKNKFYAWENNDDYTVEVIYKCEDGTKKLITIGTYFIAAKGETDFYIGDMTLTGTKIKEAFGDVHGTLDTGNWIDGRDNWRNFDWYKREEGYQKLSTRDKWLLKKGLYYEGSVFNFDINSINAGILNLPDDTNTICIGTAEAEGDSAITIIPYSRGTQEYFDAFGYSMDMHSHVYPTDDENLDGSYMSSFLAKKVIRWFKFCAYGNKCVNKLPYLYGYKKSLTGNEYETIYLPSIYRPFFFRAVVDLDDKKFYCKIYNGATYSVNNGGSMRYRLGQAVLNINGKKYYVKRNGADFLFTDEEKEAELYRESDEWFGERSLGFTIDLPEGVIDEVNQPVNSFLFTVSEGGPKNYYGATEIEEVSDGVIGVSFPKINSDGTVEANFDNGVRLYDIRFSHPNVRINESLSELAANNYDSATPGNYNELYGYGMDPTEWTSVHTRSYNDNNYRNIKDWEVTIKTNIDANTQTVTYKLSTDTVSGTPRSGGGILAIADAYTSLSGKWGDWDTAYGYEVSEEPEGQYSFVPFHTSVLSVIKRYYNV